VDLLAKKDASCSIPLTDYTVHSCSRILVADWNKKHGFCPGRRANYYPTMTVDTSVLELWVSSELTTKNNDNILVSFWEEIVLESIELC